MLLLTSNANTHRLEHPFIQFKTVTPSNSVASPHRSPHSVILVILLCLVSAFEVPRQAKVHGVNDEFSAGLQDPSTSMMVRCRYLRISQRCKILLVEKSYIKRHDKLEKAGAEEEEEWRGWFGSVCVVEQIMNMETNKAAWFSETPLFYFLGPRTNTQVKRVGNVCTLYCWHRKKNIHRIHISHRCTSMQPPLPFLSSLGPLDWIDSQFFIFLLFILLNVSYFFTTRVVTWSSATE